MFGLKNYRENIRNGARPIMVGLENLRLPVLFFDGQTRDYKKIMKKLKTKTKKIILFS